MRQLFSTELAIAAGLLIGAVALVFALVQSPDVYAPEPHYFTGTTIPHGLEGRLECDRCHGPEGILPYPRNHLGWQNHSCLGCHQPAPDVR